MMNKQAQALDKSDKNLLHSSSDDNYDDDDDDDDGDGDDDNNDDEEEQDVDRPSDGNQADLETDNSFLTHRRTIKSLLNYNDRGDYNKTRSNDSVVTKSMPQQMVSSSCDQQQQQQQQGSRVTIRHRKRPRESDKRQTKDKKNVNIGDDHDGHDDKSNNRDEGIERRTNNERDGSASCDYSIGDDDIDHRGYRYDDKATQLAAFNNYKNPMPLRSRLSLARRCKPKQERRRRRQQQQSTVAFDQFGSSKSSSSSSLSSSTSLNNHFICDQCYRSTRLDDECGDVKIACLCSSLDKPDKNYYLDKNNNIDNNSSSSDNDNNNNLGTEACQNLPRRRRPLASKKKESRARTEVTSFYRCSKFGSSSPGISYLLESLAAYLGFGQLDVFEAPEWQEGANSLLRGESVRQSKQSNNTHNQQGEEQVERGQIKMPNQDSYGATGGLRYPALSQTDQDRRRRQSTTSRRHRDPYGYSRLGYNHYQKSSQRGSFFQKLKRLILLLIIIAICGLILWQIYEVLIDGESNYLGVSKESQSVLGQYKHYAVSSDAKPCAKVGKDLLAKGGHAIDAAIGTLLCMGVVLPNSLGLGGGCLMTIYDNVTKQAIVVDGREEAPDYAREDMFRDPLAASRGPLSIGVPGELAAYWEAHRRFGRLKWTELFDESIRMAEEGTPVVEHLASALRHPNHAIHIGPLLKEIMWNNATGDYVNEEEILKQPKLANTLRRIRDGGADEFYRGKTGQLFIDDLKLQGGKLSFKNLNNYKALVKNATIINLNKKLRVYTQPLPGSGIVLGIILRIMQALGYYGNEKVKHSVEGAGLFYHHLVEANKFAYAQRGALEDKPEDGERMAKLLARLQSDQFIQEAVEKIETTDKTLPLEQYGGLGYFQQDHGTAHVSVIDGQGNSVGVTTSVNLYFGSGLVSPSTGIIYNDVMDDFVSPNITNKFNLAPSKFNRIRPGRRPLSSMAPSVFVDELGRPRLVIGASGGSMITTALSLVSLRNVFMNDDIKTAIDGPRLHHQYLPNEISFESQFPPELLASLAERGHKLAVIKGRSSVVMAIGCEYRRNGTEKFITANSDYRKGGSVAGL